MSTLHSACGQVHSQTALTNAGALTGKGNTTSQDEVDVIEANTAKDDYKRLTPTLLFTGLAH